jgi:hypothetical protein
MRLFAKLGIAGGLALAAFAMPGASSSSSAATLTPLPSIDSAADHTPLLQEVRKRRRHWYRKHRSRGWSRHRSRSWRKHRRRHYINPGIYLGLGLLGGYSYNRYYYDRYYDDDVSYYRSSCGTRSEKSRCARKYRSFNWNTCRYTTYSGYQRLCPYVR